MFLLEVIPANECGHNPYSEDAAFQRALAGMCVSVYIHTQKLLQHQRARAWGPQPPLVAPGMEPRPAGAVAAVGAGLFQGFAVDRVSIC